MGSYPKKVKKFANGGTTADPVLGVGLQYQQRAADIPDLDAMSFTLEQNRANEKHLQEERDKRKVSRQTALDLINKMPATQGQKEAFTNSILTGLDEYDKKASSDVNWVFSEEGSNQYSDLIDQLLSPARQEEMKNNYSILTTGFDTLSKNNTLGSFQVQGNRATVRDKETGAVSVIPLSEIDSARHTPVTGQEAFDHLSRLPKLSPSENPLFTSMYNSNDALKSLWQFFEGATGGSGSQGLLYATSGNSAALNAAKKQAKSALPDEAKSAFAAQYLRDTNGVWSDAGFDKYLDGILDTEITKRKRFEEQLIAQKGGSADQETPLREGAGSTLVQLDTEFIATDTEGGDDQVPIHVWGKSADPVDTQSVIEELNVNGPVYSVGGEGNWFGGGVNFSAESKGGAFGIKKNLDKVYKNVRRTGNFSMPVTTGRVIDPAVNIDPTGPQDPRVSLLTGNQANMIAQYSPEQISKEAIILKSGAEKYPYGNGTINRQTPIERITVQIPDGKGGFHPAEVMAMKRSDGKYVEVRTVGMKGYVTNDGKSENFFVPMDPRESQAAFGANISAFGKRGSYFTDNNKFSGDPNSAGQVLLRKLANLNPVLFNDFVKKYGTAISSGRGIDAKLKSEIDSVLGHLESELEAGRIRQTFSIAKPEHTKKNESDTVR